MITHVAIMRGERIIQLPKPKRHHHLLEKLIKVYKQSSSIGWIQGFMNSEGNFLDRKEAYIHAIMCGQLKAKDRLSGSKILTSEDLW